MALLLPDELRKLANTYGRSSSTFKTREMLRESAMMMETLEDDVAMVKVALDYLQTKNDRLKKLTQEMQQLMQDIWEMAYPEAPSAFETAFADRMYEIRIKVDNELGTQVQP